MADERQLEIIRKGSNHWNRWRKKNPDKGIDLSDSDLTGSSLNDANLRDAHLRGSNFFEAHLSKADLTRANLSGADLTRVVLSWADLTEANLSGANLNGAEFVDANLSGANLTRADLLGVKLTGACLNMADLHEAELYESVFVDSDLTGALGLESCRHMGPSTVDHRTLIRSGSLPLVFLRGCGLPEPLIKYLRSIPNQSLDSYSLFISHSTQDREFAGRLYADLQNKGIRCWFAPHDMHGGKKIGAQIEEAIRDCDRILLILSQASMSSEWVKTEIAHALGKGLRQRRQVLFPIGLVRYEPAIREWKCFDADIGKDSAREVRDYYIPDFSDWKKRDVYQKAFDKLVRDLKAEGKAPAPDPNRASAV